MRVLHSFPRKTAALAWLDTPESDSKGRADNTLAIGPQKATRYGENTRASAASHIELHEPGTDCADGRSTRSTGPSVVFGSEPRSSWVGQWKPLALAEGTGEPFGQPGSDSKSVGRA